MIRMRFDVCVPVALLAAALCLNSARPAMAGPFTVRTLPVAQSTATSVGISGVKGDVFSIAYTTAGGVAVTKTFTYTGNGITQFTNIPAGKGTTITITNTTEPKEEAQTEKSLAFAPPAQQAVTTLAMNPGSTLLAFGQTFNLDGTFQTVATSYDIDPASPGYGSLSGYIPASSFDVVAEAGPLQINFDLAGSGPSFSLNDAAVLDADQPDTGIAVPYTQALDGTLTFMGSTQPFIGTLSGTVTFFTDDQETIAGNISLEGIGSGVFSASGSTIVTPEPSTVLLLGSALVLLAIAQQRRRSQRARLES